MTLTRRLLLATACAAGLPASRRASARGYPAGPVRIVVGFSPGTSSDIVS